MSWEAQYQYHDKLYIPTHIYTTCLYIRTMNNSAQSMRYRRSILKVTLCNTILLPTKKKVSITIAIIPLIKFTYNWIGKFGSYLNTVNKHTISKFFVILLMEVFSTYKCHLILFFVVSSIEKSDSKRLASLKQSCLLSIFYGNIIKEKL